MLIDYGRGEEECAIGVAAMMVYEQQFRSDIIQDLFGLATIRRKPEDEDVVFAVDYRTTNWTAVVKALWAGLKAADDEYPGYWEWSMGLGAIDLNDLASKIVPEAYGQFFRAGAGDSG